MGMPWIAWVAWIANLLDTANGRPAELIMEMGTLSLRKRGGRSEHASLRYIHLNQRGGGRGARGQFVET